MPTPSAALVTKKLKSLGTKERAEASAWFFKTAKGQYGYGDVFFGVNVPHQRRVAKECIDLPMAEIKKLLGSQFHECRLTALFILVGQYKRADNTAKEKIAKFYLANKKHVNNWDLVDSSASYILGNYLLDKDRSVLYKLAVSKNIWDRRIAIITTHTFIAQGDFKDTIAISQLLLDDDHDLIHKALGWTLREMGKKSQPALIDFLDAHATEMPRTALRYSLERLSDKQRKHYMHKK